MPVSGNIGTAVGAERSRLRRREDADAVLVLAACPACRPCSRMATARWRVALSNFRSPRFPAWVASSSERVTAKDGAHAAGLGAGRPDQGLDAARRRCRRSWPIRNGRTSSPTRTGGPCRRCSASTVGELGLPVGGDAVAGTVELQVVEVDVGWTRWPKSLTVTTREPRTGSSTSSRRPVSAKCPWLTPNCFPFMANGSGCVAANVARATRPLPPGGVRPSRARSAPRGSG